MTQINLLPWREEKRKIQKTQFLTMLITCCTLAFVFFLVVHFHYRNITSHNNNLNAILAAAISAEQEILNQMGSKATDAIATETQLKFIIDLYKENYSSVRLLNQMISLVPSSISVSELKRNGLEVAITGIAKSDDDITRLMNDITKSPYYTQPELSSINTIKGSDEAKNFTITFEQKRLME